MYYYYQNPKTRDLIIFDSEDSEVLILTRMTNVRVFKDNDPIDDYIQEKIGAHHKILDDVKSKVVEMKAAGRPVKEIIKEFNISKASIFAICKEGAWKKV